MLAMVWISERGDLLPTPIVSSFSGLSHELQRMQNADDLGDASILKLLMLPNAPSMLQEDSCPVLMMFIFLKGRHANIERGGKR